MNFLIENPLIAVKAPIIDFEVLHDISDNFFNSLLIFPMFIEATPAPVAEALAIPLESSCLTLSTDFLYDLSSSLRDTKASAS